jgi:hypothetical protein
LIDDPLPPIEHGPEYARNVGRMKEVLLSKKDATELYVMIDWTFLPKTEEPTEMLIEVLPHYTKVTDLHVCIWHVENISSATFAKLGEAISGLQEITKLTLHIQDGGAIFKNGFVGCAHGLGKLKKITTFEFEMNSVANVQDRQDWDHLDKDDYPLVIPGTAPDNLDGLAEFTEILAAAWKNNLTTYRIRWNNSSDFTNDLLKKWSAAVCKFDSLTTLDFNFNHIDGKIEDAGITATSTNVASMKKLTELVFNLSSNKKITDKGWIQAIHDLSTLPVLKSFKFNAYDSSEEYWKDIYNPLTKESEPKLQEELGLTDATPIEVGQTILKFPTSLTELTINFFLCQRLSDAGLKSFVDSVSQRKFTFLKVNFAKSKCTDKALEAAFEQLKANSCPTTIFPIPKARFEPYTSNQDKDLNARLAELDADGFRKVDNLENAADNDKSEVKANGYYTVTTIDTIKAKEREMLRNKDAILSKKSKKDKEKDKEGGDKEGGDKEKEIPAEKEILAVKEIPAVKEQA